MKQNYKNKEDEAKSKDLQQKGSSPLQCSVEPS